MKAVLASAFIREIISELNDPWRYTKWLKMELLKGELPGPKPSYEERLDHLSDEESDDDEEMDYSEEEEEEKEEDDGSEEGDEDEI